MGWSNAGWRSDQGGWYKNASSASFAIWDSAAKGPDIVLSGSPLLTATQPSTANFESVRATKSALTGKYYFEFLSVAHGTFDSCGISNATFNVASTFLGGDVNGISYLADGRVFINSVNFITIQSFAQGNTVCIATDLDNSKIWFRTNGGNWNNDVIGNQNPATNTGGILLSGNGLAPGPYFPTAFTANVGDSLTANFGATAYAQAVPSGTSIFGNW